MRRLLPALLAALLCGCAVPLPGAPAPTATSEPTAEPTEAPTSPALAAPIEVEEGGFAVSPPVGWVSEVVSRTATLAPSREALERGSPGPEPVLVIDATPIATLVDQFGPGAATDPASYFEISSGAAQSTGYSLSATAPITVDGRPGLAADLEGPGGAGRLAVILGEEMAIRVLGQASAEAWPAHVPAYEAVLASLRLLALPQPTPPPADAPAQPALVTEGPRGFILRLGGSAGPPNGRFVSARGLAVAPDGTLYMAESHRGVWVFAPDGELVRVFGGEELLDAYDVARSPEGDIFVADFGRNAVARFSPDGTFLGRWGSAGDRPEQFGLASPQRIAFGPDGSLYALDARPSPESGQVVSSVVRFSQDGRLLARIELPEDLAPTDLVVDAQGAIYLAETFGGVVKLAPDGRELARFGDPADPQALAAGAIDLDRVGNLVVATYGSGILKLSPTGLVIARGGAPAAPGATPAPGEFSLPNGVVAAPGGVVWVSDNSGEYSAVSALRLEVDQAAAATAQALVATPEPDAADAPPAASLMRQWASEATASSFYAPDYDPAGATGPPNVPICQDSPDAWASADPNGLETLELRYGTPVFAVGVTIHQSYNPGFVSKVELIDERGEATTVYTATPAPAGQCPLALEISFDQTLTRIVAVRLTVDQRPGANWNEIDAVELVGVP